MIGRIEIEIAIGIAIEKIKRHQDTKSLMFTALQSAMSASKDVLKVGKALPRTEIQKRKVGLGRMVTMLSRLGARCNIVKEDAAVYGFEQIDSDSDFDLEEIKFQQADVLAVHSLRQ